MNILYIILCIVIILFSLKLYRQNESFSVSNVCDLTMDNTLGKSTTELNNACKQLRIDKNNYCKESVTNLYNSVLCRNPDPVGLKGWTNRCNNGMSISQIESDFKNTAEYKNCSKCKNLCRVFYLNSYTGTPLNEGNKPQYQITGSQTISMFIHCLQNGRQNPVAKAYAGEGTITIEPDGLLHYYFGSGGGNNSPYQAFGSNKLIPFGKLTHIAIVRDNKNRTLTWYIDGKMTNEGKWASNIKNVKKSSLPLLIGEGYTANKYKGSIHDLSIYDRALSSTQISHLSKALSYSYRGCATDKPQRSLKHLLSSNATLDECANLAKSKKYRYFGLQCHECASGGDIDHGQCFADNTFVNHGKATNCIKNSQNKEMGSGWSNALYAFDNGASSNTSSTPVVKSWKQISGGLKNVSASGNGYVWGVNSSDQIYKCKKPCNGAWQQVPGDLKQVSGGQKEVWGVNSSDSIYKRPVDGSGNWAQIPGKLKNVSASDPNYVYGVNSSDQIYKCKKPCNGAWQQVQGGLKQISGDGTTTWGVNSKDNIFKM